ncbi:MAG: WXG100 family type VII secretion target [Dermatophilaceae bacterium]
MAIDTELPGDPTAVHAVADWLDAFATTLGDCARRIGRTAGDRGAVWTGDSADAYGDFGSDLKSAAEQIEDRADAVREKTRAYAQQLTWRQEDMTDHRTRAGEGGLVVAGFVIQEPPAAVRPADLPAGHTPAERAAWDRRTSAFIEAQDKVDLYDQLLTDVRGTFDQLDTWVRDNLVTMESEASSPYTVAALAGLASGLGWGVSESRFVAKARDLSIAATTAATELARRRSGNPAVRSGSKPPRAAALENASKPGTRAGNLSGLADDAAVWGKRLARGGVVTAVALGAWELSQGKSPSTVAVETVTGIAVGAAGSAVVGAVIAAGVVGAPVVATVVGVVVVGAAATYAAGWAYEQFVPQDVREKIDEGIKDTWEGAKDVAGDVGDAISDGWKSVFG